MKICSIFISMIYLIIELVESQYSIDNDGNLLGNCPNNMKDISWQKNLKDCPSTNTYLVFPAMNLINTLRDKYWVTPDGSPYIYSVN